MIADRRLKSLIDDAAAPVLCLDLAGRVRLGNPRALDALGYRQEELVGRDVFEIVFSDDLDIKLIAGLASGKLGEFRLECRLTRRDGEIRRALCVASVIRDGSGLPQLLLLILDDISRIKVAEATLKANLHDPITNLPSYLLVRDRLEVALHAHLENNSGLAVLVTDLGLGVARKDGLDELATAVTKRIAAQIRPSDTLARTAFDQFIVMIPEVQDRASAVARAQSIVASLDDLTHVYTGFQPDIGIAFFPEDGTEPESLIRRAELAMYLARGAGVRVGVVDAPVGAISARTCRPPKARNHRQRRRRRSESPAFHLRSVLSIGLVATAFVLGAASVQFGPVASLEGTRLMQHMVDSLRACERSLTECVVVTTNLPPAPVNPGPTAAETNATDPHIGLPGQGSAAVPINMHRPPAPSMPAPILPSPAPPGGGILGSGRDPLTGLAIPTRSPSPSPKAAPSPSPKVTPNPGPTATPSLGPKATPSPGPKAAVKPETFRRATGAS